MTGKRWLLALPVLTLAALGVTSCGTPTAATDPQVVSASATSGLTGDCAAVVDAYRQADEAWTTERERATADIAKAEATVKGRDRNDDFLNGEYLDEWRLAGQDPTPFADLKWDTTMTQLAATLWTSVSDEDLKSALREYAKGEAREANMTAIVGICPPTEGSMAGVVRVREDGVEVR